MLGEKKAAAPIQTAILNGRPQNPKAILDSEFSHFMKPG